MENNFDTQGYLDMELLRFTTAGSVDDGKSTLIGRLLYDSKSIFQDQVEQIEATSKKKGLEHVDLSLFTHSFSCMYDDCCTNGILGIFNLLFIAF